MSLKELLLGKEKFIRSEKEYKREIFDEYNKEILTRRGGLIGLLTNKLTRISAAKSSNHTPGAGGI